MVKSPTGSATESVLTRDAHVAGKPRRQEKGTESWVSLRLPALCRGSRGSPELDRAPHSCIKEFPVWLEDSARLLKDVYCCLLTYLFALPKF